MDTTDTLTPGVVEKLFIDNLLLEDDDEAVDFKPVEGITVSVGFHPGRLEANKDKIKALFDELPETFKQTKGGGWTFLNMCVDKNGNEWTDSLPVMEQLLLLGLAIDYVDFLVPRRMWLLLPEGMPYVVIKDIVENVTTH